MYGLVKVLSFLCSGIVAIEYAHQPNAPSTPDDLPDFRAMVTPPREYRHTNGTLRDSNLLIYKDFRATKADRGSVMLPAGGGTRLASASSLDMCRPPCGVGQELTCTAALGFSEPGGYFVPLVECGGEVRSW